MYNIDILYILGACATNEDPENSSDGIGMFKCYIRAECKKRWKFALTRQTKV
jgi:hypothetical protein